MIGFLMEWEVTPGLAFFFLSWLNGRMSSTLRMRIPARGGNGRGEKMYEAISFQPSAFSQGVARRGGSVMNTRRSAVGGLAPG